MFGVFLQVFLNNQTLLFYQKNKHTFFPSPKNNPPPLGSSEGMKCSSILVCAFSSRFLSPSFFLLDWLVGLHSTLLPLLACKPKNQRDERRKLHF